MVPYVSYVYVIGFFSPLFGMEVVGEKGTAPLPILGIDIIGYDRVGEGCWLYSVMKLVLASR